MTVTVANRKKRLLLEFFESNIVQFKKDVHKRWDVDEDIFIDEYMTLNSRQSYLSTTKVLIGTSRHIKRITGKSMFRSYKTDPERGLSFSDIDEFISDKDNSHIHSRLNDTKSGHRISNSLKRWVRFMNFDHHKKTFPTFEPVSNLKCIALKHNGEDCTRKCLPGLHVCGLHRGWGDSKKHRWSPKR
jgi:hypothetical protein